MAPRISVRPAATMSAARLSSIAPKRAAWATSRSPASWGTSMSPVAGASGTAVTMTRSRSRRSRSSVKRRGSCPVSTTLSTTEKTAAPSRDANASTTSSRSVSGVKPSRSVASLWVTPGRAGAAEQLVEHGQRVARRPGPGAYDEGQGGRLDRHALLAGELGEVVAEQARRDQAEGVVVGARADGRQHLVGLGRGEDEPQVGRRLLDQLEQGVEALRRDHVGLVDDVDLVLVAHRREERLLPQVAGVVDTTVGRRVDLDDVDRARPAAGQLATAVALAAGVGDRRLRAVERAGEDARRGRLAAAARAGEEVGVVDPVGGERGTQRLRHVVLPDDLLEGLGPVAAIERER